MYMSYQRWNSCGTLSDGEGNDINSDSHLCRMKLERCPRWPPVAIHPCRTPSLVGRARQTGWTVRCWFEMIGFDWLIASLIKLKTGGCLIAPFTSQVTATASQQKTAIRSVFSPQPTCPRCGTRCGIISVSVLTAISVAVEYLSTLTASSEVMVRLCQRWLLASSVGMVYLCQRWLLAQWLWSISVSAHFY